MTTTTKLTREEVEKWPPLGPMNLDPARVLALLADRDRLLAALERVDAEMDHASDCLVYDTSKSDTDGCSCPVVDVVAAIRAIAESRRA